MSIAEIYSVLYGMEQAYEQVLLTFGSVVGDVQDIRERLEALERRVDRELSDAVTGRDLW